jgi:uncharacterized membrane protein YesL
MVVTLGLVFAVWPLAFDQTKLSPLINPAAPAKGEAAAANLIGTSILIGAAIMAVGMALIGHPKRPRRIIRAIVTTFALALVFFTAYIFTQLNRYGFS